MSETGKIVSFQRGPGFLHDRAVKKRDRDPMDALSLLHRAEAMSPEEPLYAMEEAQLLSELGCPLDSILVLARAMCCPEPAVEGYFGLACNLFAMGYVSAALDALALYLAIDQAGQYADEAMNLISSLKFAEMLGKRGSREKRRTAALLNRAIYCMQEERFGRARDMLLSCLRRDPHMREAALVLVEADLKTGREGQACRLVRSLAPGARTGEILQMALWLSMAGGQEELVDELIGMLSQANLDEDQRALKLQIYLYLDRREEAHRMLPDMQNAAPYDRALLGAAAADAYAHGSAENAEKYWRGAQRIRPTDGIAGWYLAHPPTDELPPLAPRLSDGATRALREDCAAGRGELIPLARWALDALENQAFSDLCPRLALCEDPEAEALLREALAHPMLGVDAKQHVLTALRERGAKGPLLYCNAASVRLYSAGDMNIRMDRSAYRLLWEADEAIISCAPDCRLALLANWAALIRRAQALGRTPLFSLTPALVAHTAEEAGESIDRRGLAREFRITPRRLTHDIALIARALRKDGKQP